MEGRGRVTRYSSGEEGVCGLRTVDERGIEDLAGAENTGAAAFGAKSHVAGEQVDLVAPTKGLLHGGGSDEGYCACILPVGGEGEMTDALGGQHTGRGVEESAARRRGDAEVRMTIMLC